MEVKVKTNRCTYIMWVLQYIHDNLKKHVDLVFAGRCTQCGTRKVSRRSYWAGIKINSNELFSAIDQF